MTITILLYILTYILHTAHLCMGGEAVQNTLDIWRPNPSAFQSVNCHIGSLPSRLFMAHEGTTIRRVMSGEKELWRGTYCSLVIVQFFSCNPILLKLITEEPAGVSDILYYVREKWTRIASNTSMTSLKEIQYTSHGLMLDINYPLGPITEVRTSWCGLDVQVFIPKRLHYASEICFVNESIWKQKKDVDKPILIIIHLEHAFPIAIRLIINDGHNSMKSLYFVRDGAFKTSTGREYYDKIAVTRRETCKCHKWACCV